MYFLSTQLTNHRAGFSSRMRSTAKFGLASHADRSVSLGENKLDQKSQTFGGYAVLMIIENNIHTTIRSFVLICYILGEYTRL